MGMFDSFYFAEGVLPDNKEPAEHEFQTKCLGCDMDKYRVDKFGHVTRFETWDGVETPVDGLINEAANVYSHNFDHKPTRVQHYKIVILNSKIAFVAKTGEQGYEP